MPYTERVPKLMRQHPHKLFPALKGVDGDALALIVRDVVPLVKVVP